MNSRVKILDSMFGAAGGYDNSSSGGSSPASSNSSRSESDGSSSSADEFCQDLIEFRRHASGSCTSSSTTRKFDRSSLRSVSESSACVINDIDKHQQRMLLLLPSFSSSSSSHAGADALSRWLAGFDGGWVTDMGASARRERLPRREIGRRVRVWANALSTMERVFRLRHKQLTDAQVVSLGKLVAASASAMLKLAPAVAALRSSPSKLLAALDVYVPVSEAFPVLARMFSWGPAHPVTAAAETALSDLVDAARRCAQDLREIIRSHYPWRMPQGGEVHPCVGFWMGYFRCMLRNRITLYFVLGEGSLGLLADLISCLEAVLEEKSAALAFPGLRQVFMLNTFAQALPAARVAPRPRGAHGRLHQGLHGGVVGTRRVAPGRQRRQAEAGGRPPAPERPVERVLLGFGERVQRAEGLEGAEPRAPRHPPENGVGGSRAGVPPVSGGPPRR
jgi:hypothetical protein